MVVRDSRIFQNFTCYKAIVLKIHWPFCKLHCNFVNIWWPETTDMGIEVVYSRSSVNYSVILQLFGGPSLTITGH